MDALDKDKMKHRCVRSFVALAAMVTVVGCQKADDGRMQVYPAHGTLVVDGQPAAGAELVLYGATPDLQGPGTVAPYATTDENGNYRLRSYDPGDGAPAGKFNVTVTWPEPLPPGADEEFYEPADRLQGRYADPKTTGLTVEVPEGGGELPVLELNSSGPGG